MLLLTMLLCLFGLRIRPIGKASSALRLLLDMHQIEHHEHARQLILENFLRDLVGSYLSAVAVLTQVNKRKGRIVISAQVALILSVLVIAILLGSVLVR